MSINPFQVLFSSVSPRVPIELAVGIQDGRGMYGTGPGLSPPQPWSCVRFAPAS